LGGLKTSEASFSEAKTALKMVFRLPIVLPCLTNAA